MLFKLWKIGVRYPVLWDHSKEQLLIYVNISKFFLGSVSSGKSKLIMLRFLAFAISIGKNIVKNNFRTLIDFFTNLYSSIISYPFWIVGVVSARQCSPYQNIASWGGDCATGMMQSPIDLPTDMTATVHAPITYRKYFNGFFNLVKYFWSLLWYDLQFKSLKENQLLLLNNYFSFLVL